MNKTASGSIDTCPRPTEEKNEHPKNKEVTFIILQKNMRSMHSSEKIEELATELEGYRWDAILLNETWRHEPAELWETQHKQIFMGAGKYKNKHGVGIMLNKRWRKRIIDTEYIHQRACHQDHDPGQPSTHRFDECVLPTLEICGSPHREDVQNY